MAPSKQWMQLVDNRLDEIYLIGVQKFLNNAFQKTGEEHEIRCPCVKCYNTTLGTRKTVETHLQIHGIIRNYTFWYHHGERLGEPLSESEHEDEDENVIEECESEDEVEELLRDLYPNLDGGTTHTGCDDFLEEEPNVEARKFYSLLKDFECPLYKNSKASKLSTLIKLLHIKSMGHWSNASFTMLLKMLKEELLPDGANLLNSYYEAKKIIQELGLSYKKIDACTNDCMLYWKDDSLLDSCKSFDELHPSFAVEPRNVRLGLASDGFQPFRNSKTSRSIWPVVLIPYNLPPWLCMKQEKFILSMLIPGPNGPGDAIDTYLQPLIEEWKELWEVGIETYDASTKQNFKLHASLLWTINDFPAYENLSGWSTKGKLACPCFNKDTSSIRLTKGKKQCFMGHRRYLSQNHKWRSEKGSFDGIVEKRPPPKVNHFSDETYGSLQFYREFAQSHENARHLSDAEWSRQFIAWFKDRVAQLHKQDDSQIMEDLLSLSRGPTKYSTHSNGYVVNGYRFHVEDYDNKLRTQNCGVVVLGENDEDSENLDYYGVLRDVIELQFVMDRRVILFRCNWFDVYDEIKGVKKDEYDFVGK
ncbi:uncharacterized protein LOC125861439 [Solanum stenotomum]|uniref:uncharacterized protein LOC125861439 n=1 Tax=Solanum stenotomum TaxID=172797 RepID=UPI0020D15BE6|nr:uncharacterized protein LOC125861439 [Solanum stenotomum]